MDGLFSDPLLTLVVIFLLLLSAWVLTTKSQKVMENQSVPTTPMTPEELVGKIDWTTFPKEASHLSKVHWVRNNYSCEYTDGKEKKPSQRFAKQILAHYESTL